MIMKPTLIRIAQEVVSTEIAAGGVRWPVTSFVVRNRTSDEAVEVGTPEEARAIAAQMAVKIGGHVYRGQLPVTWAQSLSDIPRS